MQKEIWNLIRLLLDFVVLFNKTSKEPFFYNSNHKKKKIEYLERVYRYL